MSQRLLTEAVMLADDDTVQLEAARKYCDNYPSLYEKYLIKHKDDGDTSGFYSYMKSTDELAINSPGQNGIYFIAFLEREFRYVAENAMNAKEALGWSSTFMKTGIAAFALLLLDGEELHEGCLAMCQRLCYDIGFERGAASAGFLKNNEEPSVVFRKIMCRWKQGIKLTVEQMLQCLNWLKSLVKRRVDGIMEANRRKYYEECASFIAVLGEVEESWGNAGAKQAFMEEHRMAYTADGTRSAMSSAHMG